MNTRIPLTGALLAALAIAAPDSAETEAPARAEVRVALERIMTSIRKVDGVKLERFLAPSETPAIERAGTLQALQDLGDRLRIKEDQPMSELSAPLLIVRLVTVANSERASACVFVIRAGSVAGARLASYDVTAVKTKSSWALATISTTGKCQTVTDPMFADFSAP